MKKLLSTALVVAMSFLSTYAAVTSPQLCKLEHTGSGFRLLWDSNVAGISQQIEIRRVTDGTVERIMRLAPFAVNEYFVAATRENGYSYIDEDGLISGAIYSYQIRCVSGTEASPWSTELVLSCHFQPASQTPLWTGIHVLPSRAERMK